MSSVDPRLGVLIVLNTLEYGGAELRWLRTARKIDASKFRVEIAFYDSNGQRLRPTFEQSLPVTLLDRNAWGRIGFVARAAAFMRSRRFDVVHASGGTANLYGRLPAMLARVPAILGGMVGKKSLDKLALRLLYSLANIGGEGWIVNAQQIVPILRRKAWLLGNQPIHVIPNGFEPAEAIDYCPAVRTFYDEVRTRPLVVLEAGRLVPVKNHAMYLAAAERLLRRRQDIEFWLLGDGPLWQQHKEWICQRGLQEQIKLLGYRPDIDVAMDRAQIVCHTSFTEGCPNVLIEAMRAGKPVICTDCTSLEQIVQEGGNGYVIPPGDVDALVDRLDRLAGMSAEGRQRMGQRSREMFQTYFIMDIAVQRLQNVYVDAVLRGTRRSPRTLDRLRRLGIEIPPVEADK